MLKRKEFTDNTKQIESWLNHPMSWSQIAQFRNYSKEGWYNKYILGIKDPPNKQMIFGSMVGKKLETDPTYLPEIPRQSTMEYKFTAKVNDIELVGYADSYGDLTIREYKTGKTPWTQKKVDEHGQITMYALMEYLNEKIKPEDIKMSLHWIPTCEDENGEIQFVEPLVVQHFETKRTTKDVLLFAADILKLRQEMLEYAKKHI